jgi:hypothetical protein
MKFIWLLVAFGLGIVVGTQVEVVTQPAEAPVAQPTGDAPEDVEEEAGRIEVDFNDSDLAQSAFIKRRNSKGRWVDEPMKQPWDEENVLWIDLAPGTYLAWWHNEKGEHAGARMRVAKDRTTRVSVNSELVHVLPIRAGMGRLVVITRDADGAPVAGVDPVINPVPWIPDVLSFHSTNESGQTQLDLAVGTFEIKVGEDAKRVTLEDRKRTELVFIVE